MTRSNKRGRALRPVRSRGKIGYVFLAIVVLLLAFLIIWFGPKIVRLVEGVQAASQIFATPVPTPPGATPEPTPPPPSEPMTILLLGVDRREGDAGTRNDVNIVVHINPVHGFASMLSIPRDTRVLIPDFYYEKINAAYGLGELYLHDAGGGPILVKRTVEQFLDMRIHYYAEVDFQGFERIVNLVGGVTIDVPVPLVDNEYPTDDYRYTRIYIPAGLQHMDGRTALQYARSRHADSDIGRNKRQQQVLMALRDRIVRLEMLIDIDRLSDLLLEVGDTLKTDMQLDTLWGLYQLAPKIDGDKIASYALDWQVLSEISGTSILEPCVPCVQEIAREMRLDPTLRKLQQEGAYVEVRNGTWTCQGCAARTTEYLRRRGFVVIYSGQDNNAGSYTHTLVLGNADYAFTCGQLGELLHVESGAVCQSPSDSPQADIVVILGDDFKVPQE